jgi:hypothetical protein
MSALVPDDRQHGPPGRDESCVQVGCYGRSAAILIGAGRGAIRTDNDADGNSCHSVAPMP